MIAEQRRPDSQERGRPARIPRSRWQRARRSFSPPSKGTHDFEMTLTGWSNARRQFARGAGGDHGCASKDMREIATRT